MKWLVVMMVVVGGMWYLAQQNPMVVDIQWAGYTVSGVPLYVVVGGSVIVGLVVGRGMAVPRILGLYAKVRGLEKKIREKDEDHKRRMFGAKNLTILLTDVCGFTEITAKQSRKEVDELLDLQDQLLRPVIVEHKGRVVKTIGDAYLAVFESPTEAVLCGLKLQEVVKARDKFCIRVAINTGEVNLKDNDVFGKPVNVTARIEGITEPGEIYFTEATFLAMNKNEIPTVEVGMRRLKGIDEEVLVYRVIRERTSVLERLGVAEKERKKNWWERLWGKS